MRQYLGSMDGEIKNLADSETKITQITAKLEAKEDIINKLLKDQGDSRVEFSKELSSKERTIKLYKKERARMLKDLDLLIKQQPLFRDQESETKVDFGMLLNKLEQLFSHHKKESNDSDRKHKEDLKFKLKAAEEKQRKLMHSQISMMNDQLLEMNHKFEMLQRQQNSSVYDSQRAIDTQEMAT